MNKLKKKILEFKQAPKRVQWLLMAVAFIIVLILLTMLVGGNDKKSVAKKEAVIPELSFAPSSDIDFTGVVIGEQKSQNIVVTANVPVNIVGVRFHEGAPGFGISDTCKSIKQINETIGCRITLDYAPTTQSDDITIPVYIDWYAADKTEEMKETNQITVKVSAVKPKEEPKPIVVPEPQPVAAPIPMPEPEPEPIEPQQEIIREVETIAPPLPPMFQEPVKQEVPEACSDFAFPGYDNSGVQIGWIKPERGAYYFHPFDDKDCSEPTGVYNPDNGIITDIDNRGKRIGSDADHIGYNVISTGELPQLSNRPTQNMAFRAQQINQEGGSTGKGAGRLVVNQEDDELGFQPLGSVIRKKTEDVIYGTSSDERIVASQPFDRSFVLRQYKPIPATIVSDVRADASVYEKGKPLPVRATVDRNVYSDDGRTIIIPTGTLMLGYVTGELPGPYKAIGRMQINWYQFILPNGVEFNFNTEDSQPFAGDAQGRVGVPGRGSTDYMEQFLMPMLTAFVPATINLINPVADAFVNQIDLDNNTVVQSGTIRSSELAKNEIITAWNSVAQKLMVDMMDNTVPPFTIAAGTRITVYSPEDLVLVCSDETKKCYNKDYLTTSQNSTRFNYNNANRPTASQNIEEWIGQARAWQASGADQYCDGGENGELYRVKEVCATKPGSCGGYSYNTLKLWCESLNYESKKALQYNEYTKNQSQLYQQKIQDLGVDTQQFNEEILGVQYNDDGTVKNPYGGSTSSSSADVVVEETATMTCLDGTAPDANGCCTGEIYTDMGDQGFNCCPEGGGDCFPPMI